MSVIRAALDRQQELTRFVEDINTMQSRAYRLGLHQCVNELEAMKRRLVNSLERVYGSQP